MLLSMFEAIKYFFTRSHHDKCWDIIDRYRSHPKWTKHQEDRFMLMISQRLDSKLSGPSYELNCAYFIYRNLTTPDEPK